MINEGNTTQRITITTLGRYRLLRHVGKGGMGDVWLAEDPRLHRQVAIKTLPSNSQGDHEFLLRFEREAQAAAALNHPHILSVHDYGEQALPDGQTIIFIVMPYVSGGSLADRISALSASNSAMPQQEAFLYLSQAAEAIDYAHEQGVIHRDIKPANMLLRSNTWLLLADFGIARILSSDERLTQAGVGFGTPEYMAPEQAQGRAELASDNYSLAVIAYHFFTGRLPFKADSPYATTIQHITMPPPLPRQLNPSLTPAAEAVLLQGLTKDPRQRPPSARAFAAELQRSLTSAGYEPTFVKPGLPQSGRTPSTPHPDASYPPYATTAPGTSYSGSAPTVASGGPVTAGASYGGTAPIMTRRRLLIAGGAALVAAGSALGAWAFVTHPHIGQVTPPTAQKTPASSTPGNTRTGANGPFLLQGHNKPVAALAWSPSGNILASAGSNGDGLVFLWDMQAISQQNGQNPQPKAKQQFSTGIDMLLAWSPKGDMLALANAGNNQSGLQFSNDNTAVFVYSGNLAGFAPGYSNTFLFQNVVSISAMTWAPGPYLFTITQPAFNANAPYTVQAWDPTHPQHQLTSFTTTHNIFSDSNITLNPLAVAPNTTPLNLAIGTYDGVLLEELSGAGQAFHWQQRGLLKFQNTSGMSDIGALAWSPDGQFVAAILSSTDSPTSVTIWDLHSQTYVDPRTLPDSNTTLTTLTWNPASSSTLLAAGAQNGAVYIWDSSGNTLPQKTLNPTQNINSAVRALAWSADGQWLAAGYNDTNASILVWKM